MTLTPEEIEEKRQNWIKLFGNENGFDNYIDSLTLIDKDRYENGIRQSESITIDKGHEGKQE